jgi:large-conductance mechanosensitive channel
LPEFVCGEYQKGLNGISGLNVQDSWCFVSSEDDQSKSCVSNTIFKDGDCHILNNKDVCEDVSLLFGLEYECSWLKDSQRKEYCVDFNKSQNCSFYTTQKGCFESYEGLCSWVKIDDIYQCVKMESVELCEFYTDFRGCTKTNGGDICGWNSTVGKCFGVIKSCEEYVSYSGCVSVNDRCFWNGLPFTTEGKCLSLEKLYSCEDLSMTLCKDYSNIEGLTIDVEPCFYNHFSDVNEFHCITAESVMDTQCRNIETNKNIGLDEKGPKLCDNAQLLFKINGENGVGCEWDEHYNKCVDAILDNNYLPEYCSDYNSSESCNYHMIKNGSSCFWNSVDSGENENFCMRVGEVGDCVEICTNDISGFNTYFCNGNTIITDTKSEMCRWDAEKGETFERGCNCEGMEIPENCSLLNVTSLSQCKNFTSERGKCFYNGDNLNEGSGFGICSNIDDIRECEQFLYQPLCTYAKKHTYHNLESYSSISREIFLCFWNVEKEGGVCESKKLSNSMNENNPKISTLLLIIIIIAVVVFVLIIVGVLLFIIVKKVKSRRNNNKREFEMSFISSSSSSNNLITSINDLNEISGL